MKHNAALDFTLEQPQLAPAPQSAISNIRYMFQEIDQLYLDHRPATYYYSAKRIIDIAISSVFILTVMTWLTPILALLIKLTSKGSVFFIQKRTGLNGVEFNCYKFRTMFINEDADIKQVAINDKRITTIGKFLRITHLDETAQFFNVLLGDMSIVGPRPHMVYHTQYYSEVIPYYNLRLEVKPGMTGMAQIKDYIGEINGERELRKRIQWDIYYMKNRSMVLDIQILITTGFKVFKKAFGMFGGKK
jgi:putative colanic acid biosynthesis UDP-glucose lipid carrier transferase